MPAAAPAEDSEPSNAAKFAALKDQNSDFMGWISIEGTSLGNLMVQMIGDGVFADLDEARDAIHRSFDVVEYQPE